MRDSRVREAIDTAIAQAKQRTQRRRALSKNFIKLSRRQTKQKRVVDMLSKVGLDFEQVAKEAAEQHQTFESAFRKMYRGIKKLPKRTHPLPVYHLRQPEHPTPSFPFCIPAADDCSFSSPDPTFKHTCDPGKAEMGLQLISENVGGFLGIEATPWIPPVTESLWYGITPHIGGTLAVIAEVLVTGAISVMAITPNGSLDSAPSIGADARATLVVRTHQEGVTGIQAASQVIGELHCGGGGQDFHAWVEDLFVNVLYAQVLPDIPVAIEVSIELEGQGRSAFGESRIELFKVHAPLPAAGAPGVKIAALCLNLTPTVIL